MESKSGHGIPNLTVRAMDKDMLLDDLLGTIRTAEDGYFKIHYNKEDFMDLFLDRKPDIYLEILTAEGELIHSTKNFIRYNAGRFEEFNIEISAEALE